MSLTLLILKINTTFEDVQMMLKWFFDFSTGFRFSKISVECSVYICSCPWTILVGNCGKLLVLWETGDPVLKTKVRYKICKSFTWLVFYTFLVFILRRIKDGIREIKQLKSFSYPLNVFCKNYFFGRLIKRKTAANF